MGSRVRVPYAPLIRSIKITCLLRSLWASELFVVVAAGRLPVLRATVVDVFAEVGGEPAELFARVAGTAAVAAVTAVTPATDAKKACHVSTAGR